MCANKENEGLEGTMAKSKDKLNGSVNQLATAMRDVFGEAMSQVRDDVKSDLDGMEGRLNKRIDGLETRIDHVEKSIETTNKNMQAQFAQQEKKIAQEIRKVKRA